MNHQVHSRWPLLWFLALPALGTLLHECGHALAAAMMGIEAEVHYGFTTYEGGGSDLLFTLGGPLSNMLIGCAGFGWLWVRRSERRQSALDACDWLALFGALFWSRQLLSLLRILPPASGWGSPERMDEWKLSEGLGLPSYSVALVTGLVALLVCSTAVFWLLPRQMRWSLVWLGAPACALGMALWYMALGPWLLP